MVPAKTKMTTTDIHSGLFKTNCARRLTPSVLGEKPHLKFICADQLADKQIVRAVVTGFSRLLSHCASFLQNNFVRFE